MQTLWTEDQRNLYASSVEFARAKLAGSARQQDRESRFERRLWQLCAEHGVLGWFVPQAYGGSGYSVTTTVRALEGLGYGCPNNGLTLGLNGQMWSVQAPLLHFGSESLKETYLPGLCAGELIATHAMTERSSGSDSFSLATAAERCVDGYRLNGGKCYLGLAPIADLALVFAKTDAQAGRWGISAFLVETRSEGVTVGGPVDKMGLRSNPTGDLTFEDCFVHESQRLGPEGIGVSLFTQSMDWERGFVFASHIGSMARQLDRCIDYARNRRQFDQPIGKFQAISHRIAGMSSRLEISRLLINQLAELKDGNHPATQQAALAKLYISEAFVNNSMDAIRIHGALGYLSEHEVERDLRDAAGGVIYSGTSDIQKNIIASLLGL